MSVRSPSTGGPVWVWVCVARSTSCPRPSGRPTALARREGSRSTRASALHCSSVRTATLPALPASGHLELAEPGPYRLQIHLMLQPVEHFITDHLPVP